VTCNVAGDGSGSAAGVGSGQHWWSTARPWRPFVAYQCSVLPAWLYVGTISGGTSTPRASRTAGCSVAFVPCLRIQVLLFGVLQEQKVITVGLIFLMFVLIKAYTARGAHSHTAPCERGTACAAPLNMHALVLLHAGTHARREYRRAQQEKQRWARHQQQRKAKAAREKKSTA